MPLFFVLFFGYNCRYGWLGDVCRGECELGGSRAQVAKGMGCYYFEMRDIMKKVDLGGRSGMT